jgi:hypothetical protein
MPGKYYVHVIGASKTEQIRYGPYSLSGAKNFARISTTRRKSGSKSIDRAVTRGAQGPVIRVYGTSPNEQGERLWPLYSEDVNTLRGKQSLTPNEMPKRLVFNGKERDVRVKKEGQSYRAYPAK